MRTHGHAELLKAEAHIGGEHQAMAARLRLESEELASMERRAVTAARSSERSLHLASAREERRVEFVESEASDRERALRSELADHDRALRQEVRDHDARWRSEVRHASEQATAAARQAANQEVDQWAAELVAASDERLREVMNAEDEAIIEMQDAQSELHSWRAEAEACRDELRAVPVATVGATSPQRDGSAAGHAGVDLHSSKESSGEEFARKRTVVKPIDLGSPPTPAGFRSWLADVYTKCTAASNRSQQRTIRYIKGAEGCADPAVLLSVPRKWQQFDAELFSAEAQADDVPGAATQVDLTTLMKHEFQGDLSLNLDGLDAILEHLRDPPDEALLHAVVVPQLRKCKPLAFDFELYDRADEGSTDKTAQFLYDRARDYVRRKEMQDVLDSLLKPAPKVTPVKPKGAGKGDNVVEGAGDAAAKSKDVCRKFVAGTCVKGDACKYAHAGPEVAKAKAKAKADVKAKPAPKAKASAEQPKERIPALCHHVKRGNTCRYGQDCIFRRYSTPPTKGDTKAIELGAPAKMPTSATGSGAAAETPKKQMICNIRASAYDEWALDTAAALDVANPRVAGSKGKSDVATAMWSAGGIFGSIETVTTDLAPIGETITAHVLPDTPNALALGRRCAEMGFGFYWLPYAEKPSFISPSGVPCEVEVDENFVPFVRCRRPGRGRNVIAVAAAALAPAAPDLERRQESVVNIEPSIPPIPEEPGAADDSERTLLADVQRVLDMADRTEHDVVADIIANDSKFEVSQVDAKDEEQDYCSPCPGARAPEHQSMHLPRMKGRPICDDAKHLHKYKLRRSEPMVHVTGQDAIDRPFGAMLHIDWLEIRRGAQAFKTAQRALMLTDDLTMFLGAGPSNSKEASVVVELIHRHDEVPPTIRRWWSDRAAEFLAASRQVRSLQPLAHFTSAPWRHAPTAERTNRTASEGTRALLIQSGLEEAWRAMALLFWVAMWNGLMIGKDGVTPYLRRHGTPAPYKQYAFGALVLFHPHRPVPQQGAEPQHDKLQSRLVPAVLIEVTIGPGGRWASSYGVVPLLRFTSESRASKAAIRRTVDVVFPEDVTFPIKQRLAIHGAVVDKTLPMPRAFDDSGSCEILEEKGDVDTEAEFFDGMGKENAAKFDSSVPLGHVLALEPDTHGDEVQLEVVAPAGDFKPVDADVVEAQKAVDDIQPEIAIVEGGTAPPGWRVDRFGRGDRVRLVHVPPWSPRPPTCEPEAWLGIGRAAQKELRAEWGRVDAPGFAAQEARRSAWLQAKRKCVLALATPLAAVARGITPIAECPRPPGSDAGKDTATLELSDRIPQPACPAMALRPSATHLAQQARSMIVTGDYCFLLLELGCSADIGLSAAVQEQCLAVRITARDDLLLKSTKRAIHGLIRFCVLHEVEVHAWISIPCMSGCPQRFTSTTPSATTRDESLNSQLIDAAIQICEHVSRTDNTFLWECAERDWLVQDPRVVDMLSIQGTTQQVFIKQRWRIATTHSGIPIELALYSDPPNSIQEQSFVECRGKIAAASARYTPMMANLIWKALKPSTLKAMPCTLPERIMERVLPPGPPSLPSWCFLIARLVNMRSQEAKTDKAKAAIEAELEGHRNRGTWDMSKVRSLSDWMADGSYSDVVVGRVFVILGCMNSEMAEDQWRHRARAVFQGNNIWTRTGRSAYEIFEDVSNSPASLIAARCAFAVAMLTNMSCTYRDAYQAYLQAAMETDPAIMNLVELPKDWWPDSWFYDRERKQPKYHRPAVPLVYALPGHPKSGNIWESHTDAVLIVEMTGWRKVEGWHSIWLHTDGSIMVIYKHWYELGQHIVFQEAYAEVLRYPGALYHFACADPAEPLKVRTVATSMSGYLRNLVDKFRLEFKGALRKATTPHPTDGDYNAADDEPGVFQASAASSVASGLYASLVCRPDLSVAIQRMCSRVTRWTVTEDVALIRFMSYVAEHHDLELVGQLSPSDLEHLAVRIWPDADWNGDSTTTKSTSGLYCELVGIESGNCFPLAWKVSRQTATSSSSAESETVSMSSAARHCALPVQTLISDMLGVLVPVGCRVENTQAIQAIKKGYSKRLRARVRIGL
ncbi:unnamed protein product, partial [Prorocentrum cordatum]